MKPSHKNQNKSYFWKNQTWKGVLRFLSAFVFLFASFLTVSTNFTSENQPNQTTFKKQSKVQKNLKNNNSNKHQILTEGTYDESYTKVLKKDIDKNSSSNLLGLDNYQYSVGEKSEAQASFSQNLGSYSYKTRTESGWKEDYWSNEFSHHTDHRVTGFDQEGVDIWSHIVLYKNGNYVKEYDQDWNIDKHMDATWKYNYAFPVGESFEKNDSIELKMAFSNEGIPESDDFSFFKKKVSDIYNFSSDVTSIYLDKIEFDFLIDADIKQGGWWNDIYFFYKQIDTQFCWDYKRYYYNTLSKSIKAKPVYIKKSEVNAYEQNPNLLTNKLHLQNPLNSQEFKYGSEIIFNSLRFDSTSKKVLGLYYIHPKTFGSKHHSSNWKAFEVPFYYKIEKKTQPIQVKPVFMSKQDFQNHRFTDGELAKLINFENIVMSNVTFSNLQINIQKQTLTGSYFIKNLDSHQINIKSQSFVIPIHTFDFDYLLTVSPESASQWRHLPNGKLQYWHKAPKTVIRYNNDWIYSLYVYNKQNEIKERFHNEQSLWNLEPAQKKVVDQKLTSYALNFWNYEQVKQKWIGNHNLNELELLQVKPFLSEYKHLENISLEDYLYVLSETQFNFDWIENSKSFHFINNISLKDFRFQNVYLQKNQIDRNLEQTNWKLKLYNFHFLFQNSNFFANNVLKFKPLNNKNYENLHDVKIYADPLNSTQMYHEYFFQAQGVNLKQDVSFVMEDGTNLDQDFVVVKPGQNSSLKIGDFGFVNTRYWTTFADEHKEYLVLEWKNNQWWSTKYSKTIQEIDPTFELDKLEYVFNQNLNMVVNPYNNVGGKPIKASDIPRYGIEKVVDFVGDKEEEKVLESWDSGKFSHTSRIDGTALFDGIFGADTNHYLDPVGLLTNGKHKIFIKLKTMVTVFKKAFNIVIDKSTLKYETKSPGTIRETIVDDQHGNLKKLFFANEPISLLVNAKDIKQVKAEILHSNGSWYEVPVSIKSVKKEKEWVQQIDSTFDYEGFARFTLTDYAGNQEIVYFLVNKNPNELPKVATKPFSKKIAKFNDDKDIVLLKKLLDKNLLTHPLVKKASLEEVSLDQQNQSIFTPKPNLLVDHVFSLEADYKYGSKITDVGVDRMPYAADELTPFLDNLTVNPNDRWTTYNKKLNLEPNRFYRLVINTWLLETPQITTYFYTNSNGEVAFIDEETFGEDESYFGNLPLQKQTEIINAKDEKQNLLPTFFLKNFGFEVAEAKVSYSLPWYSAFNKLDLDLQNQNWKEGKYKLKLTDVFGKEHVYQFLLINKELGKDQRDKQDIFLIYEEDQNENTAFWKGDFVWNFYRYEDQNHAKFEHDQFILKAKETGLSDEQAELAYKMAKLDDKWDGRFTSGPPDGSDDWDTFLQDDSWKKHMQDTLAKVKPPKVLLGGTLYPKLEYDQFASAAKEADLSEQETRLAYQMAKLDEKWDGRFTSGPPDGSKDWKKFLKNPEWKQRFQESTQIKQPEQEQSHLWRNIGISVSSVLGTGAIAWLVWRRFRTLKIKR